MLCVADVCGPGNICRLPGGPNSLQPPAPPIQLSKSYCATNGIEYYMLNEHLQSMASMTSASSAWFRPLPLTVQVASLFGSNIVSMSFLKRKVGRLFDVRTHPPCKICSFDFHPHIFHYFSHGHCYLQQV